MKKANILILTAAMLTNPMTFAMNSPNTQQEETEENFYDQIAWVAAFYLFMVFMSEEGS